VGEEAFGPSSANEALEDISHNDEKVRG
jgi:hypothetical protein